MILWHRPGFHSHLHHHLCPCRIRLYLFHSHLFHLFPYHVLSFYPFLFVFSRRLRCIRKVFSIFLFSSSFYRQNLLSYHRCHRTCHRSPSPYHHPYPCHHRCSFH